MIRSAGPAAAVVAAAVLLRLGTSGTSAWLVPVALAALFAVLMRASWRAWAVAGGAVGLLYASAMLAALAKWGAGPMLGLWLIVAAAFAAFFAVVGLASERAPEAMRPAVIAAAWGTLTFAVDRLLYAPVFLSAPLALEVAAYRSLVGAVGASGAEALVVAMAAAIAQAIVSRRVRPLAFALPTIALFTWASTLPGAPGERGVLHAVQPSFDWKAYMARAWSLEARRELRITLDDLTRRAAAQGPGTVIWPENGTGVPDSQVQSRREAVLDALGDDGSDLVMSGLYFEDGTRSVAATHLDRDGALTRTFKSKLVPFAEADLVPRPPAVLTTRAGALGVSICFEALFGDHVRRLVDDGAELLAVTSDNASFGASLIPDWHLAYTVLRAAEVRRSILFVANRGPAVAFDIGDNSVRALTRRGDRAVATVALTRSAAPSTDSAHLVWSLLFAAPLLFLRRRESSACVPIPAYAVAAALVLAPIVEVVHTAAVRSITPSEVIDDALARGRGARGIDVFRSHFVQSDRRSCGRAALAYALTALGDATFEETVAPLVPLDDEGASLDALASAAHARGFAAEAVRAQSIDALGMHSGRAAILHLSRGHYVVLVDGAAFDPATGRIGPIDAETVEAWSGAALRIDLADPSDAGASRGRADQVSAIGW